MRGDSTPLNKPLGPSCGTLPVPCFFAPFSFLVAPSRFLRFGGLCFHFSGKKVEGGNPSNPGGRFPAKSRWWRVSPATPRGTAPKPSSSRMGWIRPLSGVRLKVGEPKQSPHGEDPHPVPLPQGGRGGIVARVLTCQKRPVGAVLAAEEAALIGASARPGQAVPARPLSTSAGEG